MVGACLILLVPFEISRSAVVSEEEDCDLWERPQSRVVSVSHDLRYLGCLHLVTLQ